MTTFNILNKLYLMRDREIESERERDSERESERERKSERESENAVIYL